jgi:hypothetical protein
VLYVTGYPQGCSGCPSGSAVIEKPVSHDRLRDSIRQLIGKQAARPVTH